MCVKNSHINCPNLKTCLHIRICKDYFKTLKELLGAFIQGRWYVHLLSLLASTCYVLRACSSLLTAS